MAFRFFEPYININETYPSDSDEEEETGVMSSTGIQQNVKAGYNNLPEDTHKFREGLVKNIAQGILERNLSQISYESSKCRDLSTSLSSRICDEVKGLGFERYKIVCIVHIGQSVANQNMIIASRCLVSYVRRVRYCNI